MEALLRLTGADEKGEKRLKDAVFGEAGVQKFQRPHGVPAVFFLAREKIRRVPCHPFVPEAVPRTEMQQITLERADLLHQGRVFVIDAHRICGKQEREFAAHEEFPHAVQGSCGLIRPLSVHPALQGKHLSAPDVGFLHPVQKAQETVGLAVTVLHFLLQIQQPEVG